MAAVAAWLVGLKSDRRNWLHMMLLLMAGGLVVYLAKQSAGMSYGVGLLATLVAGLYSLRRLDELMDVRAWLRQRLGHGC